MSQPVYITLTSTGSSPWKTVDWYTLPQQFGFAILSSGGSSGTIDITLESPSTQTYPNPTSSTPTAFVLFQSTGSNSVTGLTSVAIAAYRLTLNSQSSAGAPMTLVTIQSGA